MPGEDQNLNIVLRVKDEATKKLDTFRGKLNNLANDIPRATSASNKLALGIAAAASAATTAATTLGVLAVQAAMDAEVQMARTNTTILNTLDALRGPEWNDMVKTLGELTGSTDDFDSILNQTTEKIKQMSSAVVRLGFDDEDAAESIAKLFQRTKDLTKAQQLNVLAMDLARAKNMDLAAATDMIGLVMSGNARALKQYGIEISDTLPPMEALEELQKKVAGQAEAFSGTFQGQVARMNVAWNNFLEDVGAKIIPIIINVLVAITPLLEHLLEWQKRLEELGIFLVEHRFLLTTIAGAIIGALTPAIIYTLVPAIALMITTFAAAAIALAPWMIGGALISGFVAAIFYVWENWDAFKEGLRGIWETIKMIVKDGVNFLIGLAEGLGNAFVAAVNTVIGALNKIKFSLPSWIPGIGGKSFGINIPLAPEVRLPRFEHGGLVPGAPGEPVPIMAHGGERVIPTSRADAGTGNNYYSVVINNPVVSDRNDVNFMRRQIEDALRDVSRGHKLATI